ASQRHGEDEEAINKLFTPEFRNRLDAIIAFGHLPTEIVHQVVRKFVVQLEAQLADRGVTFELTDAATRWLADKGYDPKMGARPLGRVIQEHIKRPLAEEILFGKLVKGGTVQVDVAKPDKGSGIDGLSLTMVEDVPAPKAKRQTGKASKSKAVAKRKSSVPTISGPDKK
ncbi:MAG: ATP-dependent Clp protease ATP-binding subunit ClpA, partial [Cohaesibacter sp.]|nr:ATP-dependent Clp protease ATP-binding subunit ClpA [Cohaesibacter sp.]